MEIVAKKEKNPQKRLWLKALRIQKDMSQVDVSKALGINQVSYSQIERGVITPTVKNAKALGAYFGFDWTMFYK